MPGLDPTTTAVDAFYGWSAISAHADAATVGSWPAYVPPAASSQDATTLAGSEPQWNAAGLYNGSGSAYLSIPGVSLTGAFTVVAFGQRRLGEAFNIVGKGGGANAGIVIDTDDTLYVAVDDTSYVSVAFAPASETPFLMVVRRSAGGAVTAQATGIAQQTLGTKSGTLTVGTLLARQGNEYNGFNSKTKAIGLWAASPLSNQNVTDLSTWFAANPDYGAGL